MNYNIGEDIMSQHIQKAAEKQDELILSIYQKQPGFISLEESKSLIQVNKMIQNGEHVGTDYLFNGKRILTIYPPEFSESQGVFYVKWNYLQY